MNLDLAIQRELKRSPMDSAMHGVEENMGAGYTLKALPQTLKNVNEMFGETVAVMRPNSAASATLREPAPVIPAFAADFGDMQLNWSPDGSKWSLSRIAPVEDQPSLLGRFWRRLNNKPENNNSISIVKYGKGSAHRFLTALETDETLLTKPSWLLLTVWFLLLMEMFLLKPTKKDSLWPTPLLCLPQEILQELLLCQPAVSTTDKWK